MLLLTRSTVANNALFFFLPFSLMMYRVPISINHSFSWLIIRLALLLSIEQRAFFLDLFAQTVAETDTTSLSLYLSSLLLCSQVFALSVMYDPINCSSLYMHTPYV